MASEKRSGTIEIEKGVENEEWGLGFEKLKWCNGIWS